MRCETCRWFENFGGQGRCRRYAPLRSRPDHPERGIWPLVMPTDWCGEYQEKPHD